MTCKHTADASHPHKATSENHNKAPEAPHSVEAEEAVLGSILINPEALLDVAAFLQTEDFFIVRHGWIWEAMQRLHLRREAVDYLTVVEELRNAGRLDEVGGPAYLTYLVNNTPTSIHAEAYGRIVERAALRRRLLDAAAQLAQLAHDEERDIEAVVGQAEGVILAATGRRGAHEPVAVIDLAQQHYEHVEARYRSRGTPRGLPTGFKQLDALLGGGLVGGRLYTIAGRPGTGKSAWLLNVAHHVARAGGRVLFFTLEMSAGDATGESEILDRLCAIEAGIDTQALATGALTPDEWARYVQAVAEVSRYAIYFDDTPAITPLQARAKARRVQARDGLDLVIVDYLQLMMSGTRADNENRVVAVGLISMALKQLARELHVPVLAAAQLNRSCEQRRDKRPVLSDLRESGAIENDSDLVAFLYRDALYDADTEEPNMVEFLVRKHRQGRIDTVKLTFKPEFARFTDVFTPRVEMMEL